MKNRFFTFHSSLFIFLLVLTFASCRSSRKVVKPEKDKTLTTVTTPTPSAGKDKQDPDLSKMKIAVGTNFTSRVRATITQDGKNISTTGTLRMRYGDVIQLTLVDPVLGIAEVGRLELSPSKVLIIDRVNRRYVDTTYDEFTALKSRSIDFAAIQEFFWQEARRGDAFTYTIPAARDIRLDLQLSNKGSASNWSAHTTVSGRYTKTDANKLFSSMIDR